MANRNIILRSGKGAPLTAIDHDQNHNSFSGSVDEVTTTTYTVTFEDQGKTIELNNASMVCTLDLIATIAAASDTDAWQVTIKNANGSNASIVTTGTDTIDGSGSLTLKQSEFATLQSNSDGSRWAIISGSNLSSLSVWGEVKLGDAITDPISVKGRIDTDFIPIAGNVHSLGGNFSKWKDLFIAGIGDIAALRLTSGPDVNEISSDGTLTADSDLILVTQKAIRAAVDSKSQGVHFTGRTSNGPCVIANANNVVSVERTGPGNYRVTLIVAKPNTSYRVLVTLEEDQPTDGNIASVDKSSKVLNAFTIKCRNIVAPISDADPLAGSIHIL